MHDHNTLADNLPKTNDSDQSGSNSVVRVRVFRKSDSEGVRRLFKTCLLTGEGAPPRAHLAATIKSPSFLCALTIFIMSVMITAATVFNSEPASHILLSGRSSAAKIRLVMVISIALLALWYLCYSIYSAVGFYLQFVSTCLRTDLMDIQGHYNLHQVKSSSDKILEDSTDPELRPMGIKAFWVAETVSPVTKKTEIVGCISLGDPPPPPFTSEPGVRVAELCRMVISPHHRRQGIAGALMQACEAHAMANEHKLSAIVLRTTFYQPHARKLYAKLGYRIVLETNVRFGNADVPVFLYRKDLMGHKNKQHF
ncbi:acyl-CoA N-acyltransferase [Lentinula detonsa]|uniref:Acyl-CoA N-acyltransferase n=1 Tax=Lentinula detonsa TaxID=2804962 RepID=A0AA38UPY0_9AGAR|nr:acyl-CoA N-acyltransferase [Lentinula detonsa]